MRGDERAQMLPPVDAVECSHCRQRVHFVTRSSKPSANPRYRILYLKCPVCGAAATRLCEVGAARKRPVFVYEG